MSFLTKDERKKCWDSRDRYWDCLDGTAEEKERCLQLRKQYETSCPSQWVKHFDRKRTYLQFKEKIEKDGYISGPVEQAVSTKHAFHGCPSHNESNPLVRRHRVYRLLVVV